MLSFASDIDSIGGGGIHVRELAEALVRRGHRVTVFGYVPSGDRVCTDEQLRELDLEVPLALRGDEVPERLHPFARKPLSHSSSGVRYIRMQIPREDIERALELSGRDLGDELFRKHVEEHVAHTWGHWVGRRLDQSRFAIHHAHHWRAAMHVDQWLHVCTPHILPRLIREWQVYDFEQLQWVAMAFASSSEEHQQLIAELAPFFSQGKAVLNHAKSIILLSRPEAALVSRWLEKEWEDHEPHKPKVHFIPNGFDPSVFSPKLLRDAGTPTRLLTIGRIDPIKRFEFAVEVLAVLRRYLDANLQIIAVGSDDHYQKVLSNRVQELSLRGSVELRFIERALPSGEIANLLREADYYLQTSEYESFGMIVLEAMAVGTPVLVSDVGGMGELVRSVGGGLALPPIAQLWAGHINDLANEPTHHLALARTGQDRAREFTWDAVAEATEAVYRLAEEQGWRRFVRIRRRARVSLSHG